MFSLAPIAHSVVTAPRQRRTLRPPVGLPIREEGRWRSALTSVLLHVLVLLLVLGPVWKHDILDLVREGAGGLGPAGGGGGGNRGTGGVTQETVRYVAVAPSPPPPAATVEAPVIPPPVQPPPPKPEPTPAPQPTVKESKDASQVQGTGGGTGTDGSVGSGPGTGGGVGSGVGTGRGSSIGSGTGGGNGKIYPPTPTNLVILPIPVPSKVRPYKLIAYFDVDEKGNTTLLSFNPTKDANYNKKIRDMLLEFRFRPAVRADGTPVRDTTWITAEAP